MNRTAAMLAGLALSACSSGTPEAVISVTPPPSASPSPAASASPSLPVSPSPSPPASPTATRTSAAPAGTRYVFPIRGCRASYPRSHHDYPAADIFAARGCVVVSPVGGRVDELSRVDRWDPGTNRGEDRGGRFVSIVGDDGVRYYGSHLATVEPGLRPGARIAAGAPIGTVGTTGSARGTPPHLHFGISPPGGAWWVRRGIVWPQRYLDAWRQGRPLSPAPEVRRTPLPERCTKGC